MRLELRPVLAGAALTLLLALGGCGGGKKEPAKGGNASGEVLEATVSDAMLPIDKVRSQAPLAPRNEGEGSSSGGHSEGPQDDSSGSSDAAVPPAGDTASGPAAVAPVKPSAE